MIITIPTTERDIFRMSLEILKIFPPLLGLRSKELDVLGEILYYNYKYKDIDISIRGKVIFDFTTKVEMRDNLNMNEQSFNNHLSLLRKKGILSGRTVIKDFNIDPNNPIISFDLSWKK